MKKNSKHLLLYFLLIAVVIAVCVMLFRQTAETIKYSDIVSGFKSGDVAEFEIDRHNVINLVFKEGTASYAKWGESASYRLASLEIFHRDLGATVVDQIAAGTLIGEYVAPAQYSSLMSFLPIVLVIVACIALYVIMARQMSGNGGGGIGKMNNFGKSTAKMATPNDKDKVTFRDVAGADEEKEELVEIVEFLKAPQKFAKLGAKIPHGVLLMGPPGTGKTLLAKAVAGEAGVPFFSISGSDFVEMYVGVGASRVRDLFDTARKAPAAIIFIDEIDAVGRHRGAGLGGGHDEREQTLNQLLVEMDGFGSHEGIIVMAATNRPDILDPALLRPGRFDRQVTVNYPDIKGREEILKVHARNKPLEQDVDLSVIAKTTAGFTGADLANLLNEAALLSARKSKRLIGMKELEEAMIKVMVGPQKKSKVISDKSKKLTAYHEAGHAVSSYFVKGHDEVHQISIIPAGRAGGYTLYLPKEDRDYMSKGEMEGNIVSLLGGRVAEALTLDDISTGASNDIQRATDIARSMVTKYGMSENLGPIVYGENQEEVFLGMSMTHSRNYSEKVASEIDAEVRKIIDKAYKKTEQILNDNMQKLVFIAEYLITHEIMDEDQFKHVMESDAPTIEELEAIAAEKAEKSKNQNNNAAEQQKNNAATEEDEFSNGINPNASRYNIRKKIMEEETANNKADQASESDNDSFGK